MADDEVLNRLADLAGIEEGWIDFFGHHREVSADSKRVFLSAMGFRVGNTEETAASLAELEARPWRRMLPPVLVVPEDGERPTIPVTLPGRWERVPVEWTLVEENGTVHRGRWAPAAVPVLSERTEAGVLLRRYGFRLPGIPLPGVHRLQIDGAAGPAAMTVIVTPSHAYLPEALEDGGRLWGYATQLYALKGRKSWGIGDFTNLAEMVRLGGDQGAAAIGVNPLHALYASLPDRFSPYSPSSRTYLNTAYIDVEAVPEFEECPEARARFAETGFQAALAAARTADLVDYRAVASLKGTVLACCWRYFQTARREGRLTRARAAAFRDFQRDGGRDLRNFAVFEALQAHFLAADPDMGYWRRWPDEYQDPDSRAVQAFAESQGTCVDFHIYLQWIADAQLKAAQDAAREAGMPVGLYRDLGVGIAGDGAEAWANQPLLCPGVSIGAPPDPLNLAGQDWGLVPFNPLALYDAAYLPFLAVLEANMRHAGAMRLDHAMSLQRLYWVPNGARADQGAYVRYPVETLFGLVALASRRRKCLVVGEDLGTVPEGFRKRMAERDILGYRLLVFEKEGLGIRRPERFPPKALIAFGTHDVPSLAGWWAATDVEARERLAIYPDPAMGKSEAMARLQDRALMVQALHQAGLLEAGFPTSPQISERRLERLAAAIHLYLARTPSMLLMIQLEDLLGLSLQMNLPGTTDQRPNWRIRYPGQTPALLADPRLAAAIAGVVGERPGGPQPRRSVPERLDKSVHQLFES